MDLATDIIEDMAINKAYEYMSAVERTFKDDEEKCAQFLELLNDYGRGGIDSMGLATRVKELFKGHHDLILGFNSFLPKGHEIKLDDWGQKKTIYDALTYLMIVKDTFKDDDEMYAALLQILDDFKSKRIDANEVAVRVKELFKGHSDLIIGFNAFLPEGYEIKLF